MAIQTSFNKIKSDSIQRLISAQVVVKANLDTSSDNGVILGTSADARALAIEPMQGEVLINGKVNFKTIYLSSEIGITSLDYYADFTDTIKESSITPSSRLLMKMNVIDTDSIINGGDIQLTAVVEIVLDEIRGEELDMMTSVDESVFSRYTNISTQHLKGITEGAFELYEEIETGGEIDKVLIYDTQISLQSIKANNNTVIIGGEAYAIITYKSGENLLSRNIVIPFTEELDAEGATSESVVLPELIIKNKRIVLSGSKGDNIIRAEMVIGVKTIVFQSVEIKAITDVYSTTINVVAEEKQLEQIKLVKSCCYKEKISAVAALDEGMPKVNNILSVCLSRNNLANLIAKDGEIIAEGLMTACVLYLDESGKPISVKAELPYSLSINDPDIKETDIINGYGAVFNVIARCDTGRDIEVKADVRICVNICRKNKSRIIISLTEGEKKDIRLNALSMYIAAGGEEMWDIIKLMSASEEDILSQNPGLSLPLAAGIRVKLYRNI